MSPSASLLIALLALALVFGGLWRRRARGRVRVPFARAAMYPGRLAEGLIHALISDRGYLRTDTRILTSLDAGLLIEREGSCGRLLLMPALGFGSAGDLGAVRRLADAHATHRRTTMLIIGGGRDFGRAALAAAAPLPALHVADDGVLSDSRRFPGSSAAHLVVANALDRMESDLRAGALPTVDLEAALSLAVPDFDQGPKPASIPRGVVTPALTAAILLSFAAEAIFSRDALSGGGAAISVVYRMGAIQTDAVWQGEPERLLAAPFLHFGVVHIAMNGWAQWSLGLPLEYLVGARAFLALWVVSALGSSLTSLVFNDGAVAAGASGAVFGLLGAFTTFVFLRRDVLPQPVPRSLRNGVLITLLLNLGISFVPGIDTAAHAGGFVTGAVAGLLLSRRTESLTRREAWRLRVLIAILLACGVGVASLRGRPWEASAPPTEGSEYKVGSLSLPLPRGFVATERSAGGLTLVEMDGTPRSPFVITYKLTAQQSDDEQATRLLDSLRKREPVGGPSEWIALSRVGTEGRRAIEVVVVAPDSCRAEAERLSAWLAQGIRETASSAP